MHWNNKPEWEDFKVSSAMSAGQSVLADLFNTLVHNLLALKQRGEK